MVEAAKLRQYHHSMLRPWHIPVLAVSPWRLVPELDKFSDPECERIFASYKNVRGAGLLAALPVAICGAAVLIAVQDGLERVFGRGSVWVDVDTPQGRWLKTIVGAICIVLIVTAAFMPYAVFVGAAIRRRITQVSCPRCRYMLVGLHIDAGAVCCPECGHQVVLADHGLTPDDIHAVGQSPYEGRRRSSVLARRFWTLAVAPGLCITLFIATGSGWLAQAAFFSAIGLLLLFARNPLGAADLIPWPRWWR